jgi:hypothetical protein
LQNVLKRGLPTLDLEIERRVQRCVQQIERTPWAEVWAAAARRLEATRPEGACAALVGHLPRASDEAEEEALSKAVYTLGMHDGQTDPALVAALRDPHPSRRAVAALTLGRFGNAMERAAVREVLRTDLYLGVRLRAAEGLLGARDPEPIPVLLAIVAEGSPELARKADTLLRQAAGAAAPEAVPGDDPATRRKCRAAWDAWWVATQDKVDLSRVEVGPFPADAPGRVRDVALHFVRALLKADLPALRRTTDVPFLVTADQIVRTRAEFDALLAKEVKDGGQPNATVTIRSLLRMPDYLKDARNEKERMALGELRGPGMYAILVDIREGGNGGMVVPLFVRVRGSRAWVVGIGSERNREKS